MSIQFNFLDLSAISFVIYFLGTIFKTLTISYAYIKFSKLTKITTIFLIYFISFLITSIHSILTFSLNSTIYDVFLYILTICLFNYIFSNIKLNNSLIASIVSIALYYVLNIFSIVLSYIINKLIFTPPDIINFILMSIIHISLLILIFKIPKFKNGFSFLSKKSNTDYIDVLILHIGSILLLLFIILADTNVNNLILGMNLFPPFIFFSIIMSITIYKSFKQYYRQKLVENQIVDLKLKVESKEKEIELLKHQNLEYSKQNHSIMHKQKSLEYKLNKLELNTEMANELSNITFSSVINTKLKSTGIDRIDYMLKYMQSECTKNNIEFELILNGNIHHIVNNFISINDLEILLADHIKNAIIAIQHSSNINKSILVKLGLFDNSYSIWIYDSGIEFEQNTLKRLGKEPSTTHSSNGGTGMGFMNTFDTLSKSKASMLIKELGQPTADNYTKIIIIKFGEKFNFKVEGYRDLS